MFNETKVLGYEIKGMIIYRQIFYMNVILRNPELGSYFLLLSCFFFSKTMVSGAMLQFLPLLQFLQLRGTKIALSLPFISSVS